MALKLNHSMIIAGPSNCGKTVLITKLIKNKNEYFDKPIKRVLWCYGENHPRIKNVVYHEGIPDLDMLKEGDLLILDDLAFDANKDVTTIFTRISHNRKLFTIFVTQNMFANGNRTRSLNTHYFILFRNPRDACQISVLARQMGTPLNEIFNMVTKNNPYSYLFIDLTATTPDAIRLQSGILKNEIQKYYIPKSEFNAKEILNLIIHEKIRLNPKQMKAFIANKQKVKNILKNNLDSNLNFLFCKHFSKFVVL